MIYVASLSAPVKKAFADKCRSTNVGAIIEQMSIDPQVSSMDACVLGPRDVVGVNRTKVQAAVRTKHPDVCVIYIYTKDKEADLLDVPFKKLVKKINEESVQEAVLQFLDTHLVSANKTVPSRDEKVVKPIKSRPTDRTLGAGGVKGNLLKRAAVEQKTEEPSSDIQYDEATQLYYYLDPLGQMVYCDEETQEPLPMSEVRKQRERLAAEAKKSSPLLQQGSSQAEADEDDDDWDIPVNMGGSQSNEETQPELPTKSDISFQDRTATSLEKNIESIRDFHDWGVLKQQLTKDAAVRELIEENTTFQGVVQMLNVLDVEIKTAYYDQGLTAEQKFEKILEIGGRRSVLMATKNDLVTRKVLDIMEAVTISARRTVEELLNDHRRAMEQLTVSEEDIGNEATVLDLIKRRADAEFELLAVVKGIISLYQAMDIEINEAILDLDKNIPSDNEFINNMVGPAAGVLTPTNTKELAHTMMTSLQNKREVMSLMQDSVDKVIDAIHNILQRDKDIIDHQQYMIKMLKAHRVEDAVVIDGVIKNILHLYVGSSGTGRTATTLTWSGVLSRRRNTLLIDLTGDNRLRDYGVEPIPVDEFLRTRMDRALCVVEGQIDDPEELMEMVRELKTRLDYYAYINIVLSADQIDTIQTLSEEAYTLNYITDCTNESITDIAECYKNNTTANIARKLLMIDPPLDVLKIAGRIGADVTATKCITIPNLPKVKMCALTNDAPYEYSEVRMAFEEAFR